MLEFGGQREIEGGGVCQPDRRAPLHPLGFGIRQRLSDQRAAFPGGELQERHRRAVHQTRQIQSDLRGCSYAAIKQELRIEILAELVATRHEPSAARVGRASVQRERRVACRAAKTGREQTSQRTPAPQLLALDQERPLTILAQACRIGGNNGTQCSCLEIVSRVEAQRGTITQVHPADVDDLVGAGMPAQVRLPQRIHIGLARRLVAMRKVEPV